jgi:hypothetical protein
MDNQVYIGLLLVQKMFLDRVQNCLFYQIMHQFRGRKGNVEALLLIRVHVFCI